MVGPRQLSKNEFHELVEYATSPRPDDMYPFLYVDCFAPVKTRFRRNYTETLEIDDGSSQAAPPRGKRKRPSGQNCFFILLFLIYTIFIHLM